jgi:choline monooxygenase
MSETPFQFDIDPDITRAWTPPSALYTSPEAFADIRERVFARSWQLVDLHEPTRPKSVTPLTLLPGSLDEPIVITNDGASNVRCLSNVCTHRGNIVCTKPTRGSELKCGYHARRFGLDGAFKSMPEFDGAKDFPSPKDSLPTLPLHHWGPLSFTSLDPATTFDDWIGPVRDRLRWLKFDEPGLFALAEGRQREYTFDANWALYCDNYLEGFHIPFVHPGLNAAIDWSEYTTECGDAAHGQGSWVLQVGDAKPNEPAFRIPGGGPDHDRRVAAYWFFLFPNLMLNFYPWGLSVNVVEPLGHASVRVRYTTCVDSRAASR